MPLLSVPIISGGDGGEVTCSLNEDFTDCSEIVSKICSEILSEIVSEILSDIVSEIVYEIVSVMDNEMVSALALFLN